MNICAFVGVLIKQIKQVDKHSLVPALDHAPSHLLTTAAPELVPPSLKTNLAYPLNKIRG